MTNQRIPCPTDASYKAAVLIREVGAVSRKTLFEQIQFSKSPSHAHRQLDHAIDSGWLDVERSNIILGMTAIAHFAERARATAPYVGKVAEVRTPRDPSSIPALSKRFIPNVRGTRADVPEYSLRSGARYMSLAGGA